MSEIDNYKQRLARHDWTYEYSDHYGTWVKGRDERQSLHAAARKLDPDYAIWNALAPEGYRIKQEA